MDTTKFFFILSQQNDLDFQALGAVRTTVEPTREFPWTVWILTESHHQLLQLSLFKILIQGTFPPTESYADDEYYDYIPDALSALLYMAAQISEETFNQTIDWIYATYGHIYKDDDEGTINFAPEDLPYFIEDLNKAKELLSK